MSNRNEIFQNNRCLTTKETAKVIDAITKSIEELLVKDGKVQLIDFGAFEKRTRAKRHGRNPQNGEEIEIPETIVTAFKTGKHLKEVVKPKNLFIISEICYNQDKKGFDDKLV